MAIYHMSVKNISRKEGRSAVASAAYRSGEKLYNQYDGLSHDFTNKKGIVHTEILLPQNAPSEFFNRELLWNMVEMAEKRKDSRTAREVEIALPNELTLDEQVELVRSYVTTVFISQGMCADIALHEGHRIHQNEGEKNKTKNNPHAHILLTTRPIGQDGFTDKKNRNWDKRENVLLWRKQWTEFQNREFERKGLQIRVNHESYSMQGIDREPTKHLGHIVTALERQGIQTDRGNENRDIMARNKEREYLRQQKQEKKHNRNMERDFSR